MFSGTICLEVIFLYFYSEMVFVFVIEVYFLYAANLVCASSLLAYVGELSPLILGDIKDR